MKALPGAEMPQLDAAGIVSQGRLAFALTDFLVYTHSAKLGIEIAPAWGPLWDKQTQQKMEQMVRSGRKYLMFFDGDGAWDMQDILELYDIIDNHTVDGQPIDAVFPVQADRNGEVPLAYQWLANDFNEGPFDYSTRYTQVVHGHFGLTFIRCEALKRTPLPWLRLQPGQGGSYLKGTPGQMDPDTYFWWQFQRAGNTTVQANRAIVGHIELCVRWQKGIEVVSQPINDYIGNGRPKDTRIAQEAEYVQAGKGHLTGYRKGGPQ